MKTKNLYLIFLLSSFYLSLKGQVCTDDYINNFKPNKINGKIDWQYFPDFSLPFKIIYGGPISSNTEPETILKKGFSHISNLYYLPLKNRAIIYYNPCLIEGQPIQELRSPWGNNMDLFHKKWLNDIQDLKKYTNSETNIVSDIFVFDIEKQFKTDWQILVLKRESSTPESIKNLSDQDFINKYKVDLQEFYASICSFFFANGLNPSMTKVSSYSDAPIWNNFGSIPNQNWNSWTQNTNNLNYLLKDWDNNNLGGDFNKYMGFFMPSAYYNYDYPNEAAPYYLAYLLFQIEVNKSWANKEIMPFVWLKYNNSGNYFKEPIKYWMSEATAIFPFFWGASGLWLWEDPNDPLNELNYANYEYFNLGLYRLSKFKEFFTSNMTVVPSTNSRDLFVSKSPIWKGIVKENKILIVAHNPFASDENAETKINIKYNSWSKEIILRGYEIHLCEYNLNEITSTDPTIKAFQVFPNPNKGLLNISWNKYINETMQFTLIDNYSKIIWQNSSNPNGFDISFDIGKISNGVYLLKIQSNSGIETHKVIF